MRYWMRVLVVLLCPVILVAWLKFAGSYSWPRDVFLIGVITAAFVWWRLRRQKRNDALHPGAKPASRGSWVSPGLWMVWLIACWTGLSVADVALRKHEPLPGNAWTRDTGSPGNSSPRIGLALSGGGYRAALVHAGVIQELSHHGIRVTNIATVSGGSIIGSFVAHGGNPDDFVAAVVAGRFNLKRELTSALNLPRWLLPFSDFSRRDVQASLLRQGLFARADAANARGPALMVALTDLRRGLSVGMTRDGALLSGPTTTRFFRFDDAIAISAPRDLAAIVATSGAFPGAFPALHTSIRITTVPESIATTRYTPRTLDFALVDGGVRDNLGVRLMQAIDEEARGLGRTSLSWPGFKPGPEWALDLLIVSDGGQSFDAVEGPLTLLGQIGRAIDLSGLETGILRPIDMSRLRVVPLSIASQFSLSPDAIIVQGPDRNKSAARRDFFQPQRLSDAALTRLVSLLPARTNASNTLADYLRTRSGPINIANVDERCSSAGNADLFECHWRRLTDLILDDIDAVTAAFRSSATLRDRYSRKEADALIRLGRYFVLANIDGLKASINALPAPAK